MWNKIEISPSSSIVKRVNCLQYLRSKHEKEIGEQKSSWETLRARTGEIESLRHPNLGTLAYVPALHVTLNL